MNSNNNNVVIPAQPGQYNINGTGTSNCLQSANHLNYTHYANVCTGQEYDINLGFWDVAGFGVLCFIGLAFGVIMAVAIIKLIFD